MNTYAADLVFPSSCTYLYYVGLFSCFTTNCGYYTLALPAQVVLLEVLCPWIHGPSHGTLTLRVAVLLFFVVASTVSYSRNTGTLVWQW